MGQNWVETETAGCDLGDVRLNRRLGAMLVALGERPGKSLPTAFQHWSNTKAVYRFLSNGNVSEDKILEDHFTASALRIQTTDGHCAVLSIRYATMTVRPTIGKQRKYNHQNIQIIHAEECNPPVDRAPSSGS
ncbi:MAG: hypothetical protein KJ731_12085 [Alphaproteobacteria bacterium]|nr:hypothetical protein [Alphaproteobacteria bacterium]MBU1279256.1 hypothetical protein [Alphaproteobacteria bacterium]MBU1574613.1 hypothetical protein [Alphaproteobacteria bacterium]MBU1829193.1 hypothetical protein [Alphaproteobacteria bacterium]MBU2242488.1 hypothetical protein [Alphaproteobacteria bacterium]